MHSPTPPAVTLTDGENGRCSAGGSSRAIGVAEREAVDDEVAGASCPRATARAA